MREWEPEIETQSGISGLMSIARQPSSAPSPQRPPKREKMMEEAEEGLQPP